MRDTIHPLKNCIPYKLAKDATVKWLYINDKRFTEPFFDETIIKCKSLELNSKRFASASGIEWLNEAAEKIDCLSPSAFIFHVSRCGSTLLSQLLALDERHISLSEAPLLDELLRLHDSFGITSSEAEAAFRSSIKMMGQKRGGNEKHLFIKLDSWHIIYWRIIRKLYPNVPFVLLYRSPAEIVRSHNKQRGMHMVPGVIDPALFGFTKEVFDAPLDEYTAMVLDKFYTGFEEMVLEDHCSLPVNYNEGIMNIIGQVQDHLELSFDKDSISAMEERSRFHSKFPGDTFTEAPAQTELTEALRKAAGSYDSLDRSRIARH